jgi:hypothetical protein
VPGSKRLRIGDAHAVRTTIFPAGRSGLPAACNGLLCLARTHLGRLAGLAGTPPHPPPRRDGLVDGHRGARVPHPTSAMQGLGARGAEPNHRAAREAGLQTDGQTTCEPRTSGSACRPAPSRTTKPAPATTAYTRLREMYSRPHRLAVESTRGPRSRGATRPRDAAQGVHPPRSAFPAGCCDEQGEDGTGSRATYPRSVGAAARALGDSRGKQPTPPDRQLSQTYSALALRAVAPIKRTVCAARAPGSKPSCEQPKKRQTPASIGQICRSVGHNWCK